MEERLSAYEREFPETKNGASGKHREKSQLRHNGEAENTSETPDRFTKETAKIMVVRERSKLAVKQIIAPRVSERWPSDNRP